MSLKILVVDDSYDTSSMMRLLLQKDGHSIKTADSVQNALLEINKNHFDMIISDLSLPDGDGKDLIKKLRQENSTILAIAATGYCTPEDIKACQAAGFDAHIGKPFDFKELMNTINELSESVA